MLKPHANHPTSPAASSLIDLARKVPLIPAVLASLFAWFFAPKHASNEFYVVTAQIIPLLFIAIALEARLLSVRFQSTASSTTKIPDSHQSLDEITEKADEPSDDSSKLPAKANEPITHRPREKCRRFKQLRCALDNGCRFRLLVGLYAGLTALLLLAGEASALNVVAEGTHQNADSKWAVGAIALGLFAVLLAPARNAPTDS